MSNELSILTDLRSGKLALPQLQTQYGIHIREYHDRLVLNYGQISSYDYRFDSIVRVCRQLIISKDFSRVLHRSFDRFFNYGEDSNSDSFDISQAVCEEKLDGSLIGLYHDGEKWCHCSKSMAYAEGNLNVENGKYKTFSEVIDNEIDLYPIYEKGNPEYSYLFELMSEFDTHVAKVTGNSMYLLAVRNKETGEYVDVYAEGKRIGWNLYPKTYRFSSLQEIMNNVNSLPTNEEGYVCRIGDWRVKIKNPAHVAMANFISNNLLTEKTIIEIVGKYEEEEYLSYNPEKRDIFLPWIEVRDKMKDYLISIYEKNYDENRGIFSKNISSYPNSIRSFLFFLMDSDGDFSRAYDRVKTPYMERLFKELKSIL